MCSHATEAIIELVVNKIDQLRTLIVLISSCAILSYRVTYEYTDDHDVQELITDRSETARG